MVGHCAFAANRPTLVARRSRCAKLGGTFDFFALDLGLVLACSIACCAGSWPLPFTHGRLAHWKGDNIAEWLAALADTAVVGPWHVDGCIGAGGVGAPIGFAASRADAL